MLTRRDLIERSAGLGLAAAVPVRLQATDLGDWSGDIAILRPAWQTMHPGLTRYATASRIAADLDRLADGWKRPSSFRERFLALSRVTASVKCGHTYPSPYNGGETVVQRLYPDRSLVPFRFRWIDSRMIVTQDDSAQGLFPRGTIVTAIDGIRTEGLLTQLVPLARADGGNDAKRVSLMEVRGDDRYETFDIHLPLVLPLRDAAAFTLSDGRVVTAPLMTLAERQASRPASADPAPGANPWRIDGTRTGSSA